MSDIKWSVLFPSKLSVFIFILYMALFINQGLMVRSSQDKNGTYSYNTVVVVLLTEVGKLVVCFLYYLKEHNISSLYEIIAANLKVLALYFVPAILYCFYNNFAFINLSTYDPTTYFLLLQFRVVMTGIIYQILFGYYLTKIQWVSLIILTIGCIVKQLDGSVLSLTLDIGSFFSTYSVSSVFILVQALCSVVAGVYNEKLLKHSGVEVHILVQNIFMYIDSVIVNVFVWFLSGKISTAFNEDALREVLQWRVLLIIVNNMAVGIVTSFFLKNLNSILKNFASALELVFMAVLCWLLLGTPITVKTVVSIFLVISATYIYATNPVVTPKVQKNDTDLEKSSIKT